VTEVRVQPINPSVLPEATGTYTHGTLVTGARRMVFVSGQVPWGDESGKVPEDLADRQYRAAAGRIREEVLGTGRRSPSSSPTSTPKSGCWRSRRLPSIRKGSDAIDKQR
jgi:hypothetical protein